MSSEKIIAYTCPICRLVSHHPKDAEYRHCAQCGSYTEIIDFCGKLREVTGMPIVIPMPGRRYVGVVRKVFTHAVIVGKVGDFHTYDDTWCYYTLDGAAKAIVEWHGRRYEGEPDGWHRHNFSGRRRDEHGNEWIHK